MDNRYLSNWRTVTLGEIGEFKNGINKDKEDFGFGVKFINLMDVFGKTEVLNADYGLVNASADEVTNYALQKGDILFVRSSVKPIGVGLTAVVTENLPETVFSGFLIRYRNNGSIDLDYSRHCFYETGFRRALLTKSTISANTNINQESLKSLLLPLPPLAEQRQIAAILSTWDEAITRTTQLIAALQRRKQALMQLLLTGAVRFPEFDGSEWEEVRLTDISAKLESGGTPSTQVDAYWNGEIPWITGADFGDLTISQIRRYITEEAVSNSSTKVAYAGDILLVSRTGVGKIAIAPFDIAISQDITRVVPKPDLANTSYLLYYLAYTTLQLARFNQGTSINGVTRDDLKNHSVQLPSIEEQAKIASFLDVCNEQISDLQVTVEQLLTQKRGLMQQLLTGAVRVPLSASSSKL